jgi:hypothetical protein
MFMRENEAQALNGRVAPFTAAWARGGQGKDRLISNQSRICSSVPRCGAA